MFSSNRTKVSSPSSNGTDGSATFSWVPSYSHEENFSQVEPALDLLVQCVRESVAEAQSRQFAEQLLSVTLHHLYGLQADALVVVRDCWGSLSPSPEECQEVEVLEGILGKLMVKIGQLRRFQRMLLAKSVLTTRPSQAVDIEEGVGTYPKEELSEWDDMDSNVRAHHTLLVLFFFIYLQELLWICLPIQDASSFEGLCGNSAQVSVFLPSILSSILCY